MNIMIPVDVLVGSKCSRWLASSFIGHRWPRQYKCIVRSVTNTSYLKWIHGSWLVCISHCLCDKCLRNKSTLTLLQSCQKTTIERYHLTTSWGTWPLYIELPLLGEYSYPVRLGVQYLSASNKPGWHGRPLWLGAAMLYLSCHCL